ncbi:MAG: phosphoribosyltransferase family protein [Bacteroidota bacterium]
MLKSFKNIFYLFFPELCLTCENPLQSGEKHLCTHCLHELPLTNFCIEEDNIIEKIFYGRIPLQSATTLLYFHKKGNVQKLIHQLKYRGKQKVGKFLGNWLGENIKQSNRFRDIDCIIPVPLHPKKLKQRGYNQLSFFGESLSKILDIPFYEDVLIRKEHAAAQAFKKLSERARVKENVFEIVAPDKIKNKHILLIDDVITTGATLETCCISILDVSDTKVSVATMAYTV